MALRSVVHPPVRLRSAPACDPPYDDEQPPDWWRAGPLQPPLELPAPAGPAAGPGGGSPDRRDEAAPLPVSRAPGAGPLGAVPSAAEPATTVAVVRFVNTCLEIFNGYRPVGHFRSLTSPLAATAVVTEMTQAVQRLRRATGRRATDRLSGQRPLLKLRRMRTCEPRPGVAEVAVVIGGGEDEPVWALAYRLEQHRGRWLCTAARLV